MSSFAPKMGGLSISFFGALSPHRVFRFWLWAARAGHFPAIAPGTAQRERWLLWIIWGQSSHGSDEGPWSKRLPKILGTPPKISAAGPALEGSPGSEAAFENFGHSALAPRMASLHVCVCVFYAAL